MIPANSVDQIHRFVIDQTDIRGEIVSLGQSLHAIREHQSLPAVVDRLLAQFAAAVALLSNTLKFDGIISIQARGDGPLPLIMAECSHHKQLRAIAKPDPDAPEEQWQENDIRALVGAKGVLTITIEPDHGERYQGIVPLDAANLAQCIEHYFMQSEQLPTRLWLASSGDYAAGLMLQILPSDDQVRQQDQWHTQTELANTITDEELLLLDHQTVLRRLFHEQGVRIFDPTPVAFSCSCSQARCGEALKRLGRAELDDILQERGFVDMTCDFCRHRYEFSPLEIDALFNPETRH